MLPPRRPVSHEAFHADVLASTVQNLRFAATIGMFVVPGFWLLDRLVVPDLAWMFLQWRLGASCILAVVVLLTRTRAGRESVVALGYAALFSAALPVSAMVAYINPGVSPYYAGLDLAMLFAGVLFPWNPAHTAAVNSILVASFLLPVAMHGGPSDLGAFVNNTFFLLVTAAVSTVANWSLYKEHRRRFDLSWSLEMRSADLADANERLREADELKSRFFANVSHELRTPLTLALSPVEALLADPTLPPRLRETFHALHVDLLALRRRIEELLDLARLDSGRMRIVRAPVDLPRLVSDVVTAARPFATRQHIELDMEAEPGLPPVAGDAGVLEQIAFNLISNALKFTPSGGRVWVSVTRESSSLRLTVRDTGPGLSEADQAELFTRFGRTTTAPAARGSGLGLALVKEFAELHDGRVAVRSSPGEGAAFDVWLPVGPGTLEAVPPTTLPWQLSMDFESEMEHSVARVEPLPAAGPDRPLVLVVDDNARLRDFVARSLADEYTVVQAVDGVDALARIEVGIPMVVVADVMMPRLDGRGLLTAIRRDPRLAHLPVVLLTAHGDADLRDEALELGASDFLTKPFSVRELRARVRNFVALRAAQQALAEANTALGNSLAETQAAQRRVVRAEKLAAIGQLAAGIGHEVKNPVNFLLNFARPSAVRVAALADRLQADPAVAGELGRVREALTRIVEGGERIVHIVDGLQAFARGGGARVEVDVDAEVRSACRMVEVSLRDNVRLVLDLGDVGTVLGSPVGVGAVVLNLVTNGIQSMPNGGTLTVTTRGDESRVTLRVRDTGVGMSADVLGRIWDPFFTTRPAGEGLGLGLALVHRLVYEEFGGRLLVESQEGEGTVFTAEVPRSLPRFGGQDLARTA